MVIAALSIGGGFFIRAVYYLYMHENGFEKPNDTKEQRATQLDIKFPEAATPWERLGISKEEYDELYSDDPADPNVQLYQQK